MLKLSGPSPRGCSESEPGIDTYAPTSQRLSPFGSWPPSSRLEGELSRNLDGDQLGDLGGNYCH
jgi:hypothetical protein